MQPIIDGPRAGLNPTRVQSILTDASSVSIQFGAVWLNSSLVRMKDITPYLQSGSTISYDNTATIQANASINMQTDCPMNIITDFIQPYMVFTDDTGCSAQFNLGVYTLQSPTYDISSFLGVQSYSGYDLSYLLGQPLIDSFSIAQGDIILPKVEALLLQALPNVKIVSVDSAKTANTAMSWPLGGDGGGTTYTYNDVINQCLSAIGYDNVWFDWDGNARLMPHVDYASRSTEWTFDLSSAHNLVAEQRTVVQDLFDVPNRWVFVLSSNGDDSDSTNQSAPVEGVNKYTYVDMDPSHAGSFYNRNRYITTTSFVTAADYSSMVTLAKSQILNDLAPAETYSFSSFPLPLAWHDDVIQVHDTNLGQIEPMRDPSRRLRVITWSISLDGGSDMSWTAQSI